MTEEWIFFVWLLGAIVMFGFSIGVDGLKIGLYGLFRALVYAIAWPFVVPMLIGMVMGLHVHEKSEEGDE